MTNLLSFFYVVFTEFLVFFSDNFHCCYVYHNSKHLEKGKCCYFTFLLSFFIAKCSRLVKAGDEIFKWFISQYSFLQMFLFPDQSCEWVISHRNQWLLCKLTSFTILASATCWDWETSSTIRVCKAQERITPEKNESKTLLLAGVSGSPEAIFIFTLQGTYISFFLCVTEQRILLHLKCVTSRNSHAPLFHVFQGSCSKIFLIDTGHFLSVTSSVNTCLSHAADLS